MRAADALRWTGLGLLLVAVTGRGLTPFSNLPHWDLDPMLVGAPMLGIGPAGSLVFDCVALLGAGLALLGEAISGRSVHWKPCLLAAIGVLAVIWHGWLRDGPSLGNQRVGASWAAAVAGGIATLHLCRDGRFRRLVLGVFIGFVALLAIKGAQQWFIEHPLTVESYRRNRAAFLEAQGWSPDSMNARSYEKRLLQPEATGWYGLANVYATFAAAGVGAGFGLIGGWLLRRRLSDTKPEPLPFALVLAGPACAIAGVALAGAKGGYLAAVLTLGCTGAVVAIGRGSMPFNGLSRPSRLAGLVGVAAIAMPIALVLARGLLGERGGVLSLLYRWFYMQAATRIALAHPVAGIGPDDFQDAYLLAKSPLSVEDIKSPHMVVLDWLSTLGSFGIAWVALLVLCMWWAARGTSAAVARADHPSAATDDRSLARAVGLVAAAATIVGAMLDHGFMTIDSALARVIGLGVWAAIAWGITRMARDPATQSIALFGAAAALAAHGQIDVAASWPGSVGLFWVLIGASAAAGAPAQPARQRAWAILLPGGAAIALSTFVSVTAARSAIAWEDHLAQAAAAVAGLGGMERDLAPGASTPPERLEEIRRELSARVGARLDSSPQALAGVLVRVLRQTIPVAIDHLAAADALYPNEWRARREASRLALHAAALAAAAGSPAEVRDYADRAKAIATRSANRAGAAELAWLSAVHAARADLFPADRLAELHASTDALSRSAALDPYNLDSAWRLYHLVRQLGDAPEAAAWARRSLELDDLARLDREVHGLRPEQRDEARRAAGSS